jgi:hypothetical protein
MAANHQQPASSPAITKGLATLALLKANFDAGADHVEMFFPFVSDCIVHHPSDDFSVEDMRDALAELHGLRVPVAVVKIALTRAARRGLVKQQGGRCFRLPSAHKKPLNISALRAAIEAEQLRVASALREFAKDKAVPIASDEDALALLLGFLSQFQVSLLLESPLGDGSVPVSVDSIPASATREMRIVAQFLLQRCFPDSELREPVKRILEGFVLQNALLLKDIASATRRFVNLTVFFDSGFILDLLGLAGEAAASPARESVDLLRATGASLAIFETTLREIKRIMWVYERHLGSPDGIASLHPTSVTRYLVTHHFSPSGVREFVAMLEEQIHGFGISIKPVPTHNKLYTLDEAKLSTVLRKPDQTGLDTRVMHDVDCVAAILTLRAGHTTDSYDDARAIFATTTGLLVKNARAWYRDQAEPGLPPVIHTIALSSIAWLKRPASAANLKLHELVALCNAALAPSRRTWDLFLLNLRDMRDSKRITSDEMLAVIASSLTDSLLADFEDDMEPDATTLTEVVDRVTATYRSAASARVAEVERQAAEQVASALSDKVQIEERLKRKEEENRQMILSVQAHAYQVARAVGWLFFVVSATVLIALPPAGGRLVCVVGPPLAQYLTWSVTLVGWLVDAAVLLWGGDLRKWRRQIERRLELRLRKYWLGSAEPSQTDEGRG